MSVYYYFLSLFISLIVAFYLAYTSECSEMEFDNSTAVQYSLGLSCCFSIAAVSLWRGNLPADSDSIAEADSSDLKWTKVYEVSFSDPSITDP